MKKLVLALVMALLPMGCSVRMSPPTADMYLDWGLSHKARGDLAGAITLFSKAVELRKDFVSAYYYRAESKQGQRDFAGAAADYNTVIELAPSFLTAYLGRGKAKQSESDFDGALADYNRVISQSPTLALAYLYRGGLKQARRDLHGAIEDYTKAVQYSPKLVTAGRVPAAPQTTEAIVNKRNPTAKTCLFPNRSPAVPALSRKLANATV
jgi:tetratricopeptide (TPR) repeat protein